MPVYRDRFSVFLNASLGQVERNKSDEKKNDEIIFLGWNRFLFIMLVILIFKSNIRSNILSDNFLTKLFSGHMFIRVE